MQVMPVLRKRMEGAGVGNLPSLGNMVRDLEQYTSQSKATVKDISRCVSLDPPLSVRLLRLANSAYYSRSEPVLSIEEAVLYLGIAQVRRISMTSRCVETLIPKEQLGFQWVEFWRHCIATGHFCQTLAEVMRVPAADPETCYLVGLMHDVGKLVIAMLSPETFEELLAKATANKISFQAAEQQYADTDHGALGGWYLDVQRLPGAMFEAVRCHHNWSLAVKNPEIAALVNLADFLVRSHHVGISGNMEEISTSFVETPAWDFLMGHLDRKPDADRIQGMIEGEVDRLKSLVESILPSTPVAEGAEEPLPVRALPEGLSGDGDQDEPFGRTEDDFFEGENHSGMFSHRRP